MKAPSRTQKSYIASLADDPLVPRFVRIGILTVATFVVLLFVDVPWLGETFVKSHR